VRKDAPRIEAFGTVDELNAVLGLARTAGLPAAVDATIHRVQNELFVLGAQLAAVDPSIIPMTLIEDGHVAQLEQDIDRLEQAVPPLTHFILPGGSTAAATLHVARTVCRRAERRVVTLAGIEGEQVSPIVIRYLNRLGDMLFVAARAVNASAGLAETVWSRGGKE
jgi:cob(I)alamin adenosyltransferase